MRRLLRTGLLLAVAVVATLAVWQVASLLVNSQALAPVTGQYYVGASWMATPTPTAGPSPTATVLMTATPLPTSLPEATPEIQTVEAEPTAVPLPT
ncbi:MAG: hypothetical protein KC487_01690, partial [Anaerolineae bacterium]|nr:hypothetical protein [Anaerolineae bacterium]